MDPRRLLTDRELEEIRAGVREGIHEAGYLLGVRALLPRRGAVPGLLSTCKAVPFTLGDPRGEVPRHGCCFLDKLALGRLHGRLGVGGGPSGRTRIGARTNGHDRRSD